MRENVDSKIAAHDAYEFYKKLYSLDRIKLITICNEEMKAVKPAIDMLSPIFPETDKLSIVPEKEGLKAPRFSRETLVLIKSRDPTQRTTVYVSIDIDTNNLHSSGMVHFLLGLLEDLLENTLILKNLAVNVEIEKKFVFGFVEIKILIENSPQGNEALLPIIKVINGAIFKLKELNTQENFDEIQRRKMAHLYLDGKVKNSLDEASTLLNNFEKFGVKELFSGGSIPEIFDLEAGNKILDELRTKKKAYVVTGGFKTAGAEKVNFKDSHPLLIAPMELIKNNMIEINFLGLNNNIEPTQVSLNIVHPELGIAYAYSYLPDNIGAEVDVDRMQLLEDDFQISRETVERLTDPPSGEFRTLKSEDNWIELINKKYSFPAVSTRITFYPDPAHLDQNITHTEFNILKRIWEDRASRVNELLNDYHGNIRFDSFHSRLVLVIDVPLDNLEVTENIVLNNILKKAPTAKELSTAYYIYSNYLMRELTAEEDAIDRLEMLINLDYPSREQEINHIRELYIKSSFMKKPMVGLVYIEGYIESTELQSQIVSQLDSEFRNRKLDPKDFLDRISIFLEDNEKPVMIQYPPRNPHDDKLLLSAYYIGDDKGKNIYIPALTVLSTMLASFVPTFIQNHKEFMFMKISSYITQVSTHQVLSLMFIGYSKVIQTKALASFIVEFKETLKSLDEKTIKDVVDLEVRLLSPGGSELYEEAHSRFKYLMEGFNIDQREELAKKLRKVELKDIQELFKKKIDESNRFILLTNN